MEIVEMYRKSAPAIDPTKIPAHYSRVSHLVAQYRIGWNRCVDVRKETHKCGTVCYRVTLRKSNPEYNQLMRVGASFSFADQSEAIREAKKLLCSVEA